MYCPKCSQKQSEDALRFCSRCGFQLGVVKELLAERDSVPVVTAEPQARTFLSRRKQDLLFGATVMSVAATVVLFLSWVGPKAAVISPLWLIWLAFSLFVLFFDVLVRAARKLFSDDDEVRALPSRRIAPDFITKVSPSRSELPAMQNVPVTVPGPKRVSTGEILQPPSITEHTTNLLHKK